MSTIVENLEALAGMVGQHVGPSRWVVVDQARIDRFADATEDQQWIHVDPARAGEGPFGGTIAHGYLTLSLIPSLLREVLTLRVTAVGVNYGCDRVRFPSPVPVGSDVRLDATIAEVSRVGDAVEAKIDVTIAVRDAAKPACAARVVYRFYR